MDDAANWGAPHTLHRYAQWVKSKIGTVKTMKVYKLDFLKYK
jgi:hypothetical protein